MKQLPQQDLQFINDKLSLVAQKLSNKHIFITGATGFIGSWMLESIIYIAEKRKLNLSISILTRSKDKFLINYPHLSKYELLNILEGDVRDIKPKVIDNVDYIIHAATDTNSYLKDDNTLLLTNTIVEGTRNILEISRQQKAVKKVLFLSSGAIYGTKSISSSGFLEEDSSSIDCNNSLSSYGESKRYAELLCSIYNKQFNIPYVTARCFSFVGPRLPLDSHFAIGNFINNILNNEDIIISGNGKDIRSYLYMADLTVWLLTILISSKVAKVYNVGSDQYHNIKKIADTVIKQANTNAGCKILNQDKNNSFYAPNINRISKELNVKICNDIYESVEKTINWYK